ncbi:MAG: UMP kinase [Clostridia bacterium]|nr:UMP kinase [Clostridia bacterium]
MKYNRILLKISGDALTDGGFGIDEATLDAFVEELKRAYEQKVQIGIVIGGGNFWRGRNAQTMDRSVADHIGMLATAMNALALQEALERVGIPTRVQTAITMQRVAEPYILRKALRHLEKGRIVIFACGTGSPYFSTDTGGALRAAEIHADILLCAKNVDGVYDSDPKLNPNAVKYDELSYFDVLKNDLKVMDATAIALCRDNNIPILCFSCKVKNSIADAVSGKKIGTLIH